MGNSLKNPELPATCFFIMCMILYIIYNFSKKGGYIVRKAAAIVLALIFLISLATTVSAATGVTGGSITATITSDSACLITLDLQLHLEGSGQDLLFPVPANAKSITINGKTARTIRSGDVRNIKLSSVFGDVAGDFPIRLQYSLPGVVDYDDTGKLMLVLPLLSGFHHPIQNLSFSVTLPGDIQNGPTFTSGYYGQTIESNLDYRVSGNSISGTIINELKDRESLTLMMEVTEELFPQNPVKQWTMGVEEVLMIVLAVLAALYWILFLRSAPFIARRSTSAPEGYTAGELAGLLTGYGNDLTMMVFSWAQLGYILIHVQDSGRVTLHKRMEMGNERDPEEVRIFRTLFGKRRYIDGTGYHYANLCHKVAAGSSNARDLYKRSTGNPKVFRILCALIGLLSGISLGRAIVGDALLGIFLIAILAVVGGACAWIMQDWVRGLHLNNKTALAAGLSLAVVWSLLGAASGIWNVTTCVAGAQLLCGLATAYCGRRTILGRQIVSEFLGFRRYLKRLTPQDIQRISRSDPDYFFTMAPYALAMGVQKSFAQSFRNKQLSGCAYLTTGMDGHMTAAEWCQIMDRAVQSLDERKKRLILEQLQGK